MITLYAGKNMNGVSRAVASSDDDLSDNAIDKPGSIEMTSSVDAILLFRNKGWTGGVHYLRGVNSIANLGSPNQGGRNGFGNSVRSVRVESFVWDLNVTIVKNDAGDLPGSWASEAAAEAGIREVVKLANGVLRRNRALLVLDIARITFRTSEKHFVAPSGQTVPSSWKAPDEADVVIIDRFRSEGTAGRTPGVLPKIVRVARMNNPPDGPDFEVSDRLMASVLLHELGHYLGVHHGSGSNDPGNIMFATGNPNAPSEDLTPDQIRRIHGKLAGKGERSVRVPNEGKGIGTRR